MVNYQRWVTLSYLGLAIVAALLLRQIADVVWDLGRLPTPEKLPLTPPELIALVGAVVVLVVFRRSTTINGFANEVAVELAKVTWAPRKETMLSTGVISAMVGVCAVLLFLIDTVWGTLVRLWYR